MRMLSWIAFLGILVTGCYDIPQDRLVDGMEDETTGQNCSLGLRTGCLKGTIMSAPEIYVNNRKFEDSEDFALMFSELITVEDKDGKALGEDEFEVELLTQVNNRQFTKEFTVYLRGHDTRTVEVLRDGSFYLDYLQPGVYDLQAQRKLTFKVTRAAVVNAETGEVLEEAIEKVYCATLKAEQTIQLYAGEKIAPVLEDFELFWREQGCKADDANFGIVTL